MNKTERAKQFVLQQLALTKIKSEVDKLEDELDELYLSPFKTVASGGNMQLSGIYRWAKAQHKDLVYAEGLSEVPSASRWIKFRLLPKLEEALHTSSNTQSTKRKKKVKD